MEILKRIFGRENLENLRICVRKDSFILMRIFDNLGLSSLHGSIHTDNTEWILYTSYALLIRKNLATNPKVVREITETLMERDKEDVSKFMEKRPEFAQAIEAFIINVAEKTLESGTPNYTDCWVALTRAADVVHKYTGKDDPDEAGRLMYQHQFPRALRDAREAWDRVPEAIHGDMANLLSVAYGYGEEARMYFDGVLKQIALSS